MAVAGQGLLSEDSLSRVAYRFDGLEAAAALLGRAVALFRFLLSAVDRQCSAVNINKDRANV